MLSCEQKEKNIETEKMNNKHLAFVGTYTKKEGHVDGHGMGVEIFMTDEDYKNWEPKNKFSNIVNPSYICHSPNHSIIYAVSEGGDKSMIKVLTYNEEDYSFKEIQSISSLGNDPCHISVDRTGKFLWVANYSGGNLTEYKINKNGTLLDGKVHPHKGTGPNLSRQEGPHPHFVHQHPIRSEVYAVDLGADKVYRYQITDAGLQLDDSLSVTPGAGCRHLAWHPKGNHLYIINELNGTIESWKWHEAVKERQQIIPLRMEGEKRFPSSAAIQINEDGQYLYASLRGEFNEIIVLKNDPTTFKMEIIQRVAAGGAVPRFMGFTPDKKILTVALQDDDITLLFYIDQQTGKLKAQPQSIKVKTPVCVVYH